MEQRRGVRVAAAPYHDLREAGAVLDLGRRRNGCFKSVEPSLDEGPIVERRADDAAPCTRKGDVDPVFARGRNVREFCAGELEVAAQEVAERSEGVDGLFVVATPSFACQDKGAVDIFLSLFVQAEKC